MALARLPRPTRYPSPRRPKTTARGSPAGFNTVPPVNEPPEDNRLPRGALIVVAVGLFACLAAAVLATSPGEGQAANLEWVREARLPDSQPVDVPLNSTKYSWFPRSTTTCSGAVRYKSSTVRSTPLRLKIPRSM